jgi:N-acetylneuraminate synthase
MSKIITIAEVGINHNGDVNLAKRLILEAKTAGFDAVKFQKRTVEEVYTPADLDRPRESPFGTTNRDQKNGLEFGENEYNEINRYCEELGIDWFASAWDLPSQAFLAKYDLRFNKIASAMLTIEPLLNKVAAERKYTFISTGMSTLEEIDNAVEIFRKHDCPFELMHCNSSYPMKDSEANLTMISVLKERYGCDVGYSGHERGLSISIAAVAVGATSVERHITLDRTMYGSDQAASLGLPGIKRLVRDIRVVESAIGDGKKRIYKSEEGSREKLANPYWIQKMRGDR